jgi:hypothetical protein
VPRSPNTMHLRSSDKIPSLVRDRHNDLSSCVEHLACHLGTLDPEEWAAALHRRINRAIGRKRHEKLTSWHLKNIAMKPTSEKTAVPKAIVQSVFLKSALRKPGQSVDTDELIKRAKQIEMGDLRPDEQRAAALLAGAKSAAKRKPKEHPIEKSAERLVALILPPRKPRKASTGRPKGSGSAKIRMVGLEYKVPLSAIDVCAAVLPIIEEVTKSQLKPAGWDTEPTKDDLAFEVVVAAVNTELSTTKRTSVARAIYRLKARNQLKIGDNSTM